MKNIVILTAFLGFSEFICAQLNGAQWIVGDSPVSTLDFRSDPVALDSICSSFGFILTNANICDGQGNLLYITNGIFIADRNGDTLLNGYGINPCSYTADLVS